MKKNKLLIFISIFTFTTSMFSQIENGLIAKYSFNNGDATDEIGNNHGTVNGATLTTDRFGNIGKAYSFNGTSNYINFGDMPEFNMGNNDFTISLWVNYSATQEASIISKRAGGGANYNMYAISILNDPQFGGVSQNVWHFSRSSNSNDRDINAGNLAGDWHLITLIHDYSDSSSIFVDGQFISSDYNTVSGNYDISGFPLVLGYSSESNSNFYNGSVDDVAIYNRILTASEALELYNEPNPVTSGIDDMSELYNQTIIYPNPTNGQINLTNISNVKITDLRGKIVLEKSNTNSIDISNQNEGIYFVQLFDTNEQLIQCVKIIKE